MSEYETLTYETRGHVRLIGLNRPDKLNAFNLAMLSELGQAFSKFETDDDARCAVLFAHGKAFTAGLDLGEVGPAVRKGAPLFPDGVDPLGVTGPARTKPVVMAMQGHCLTIGIELALACDIRIAADDTKFGQIEINRGIVPFGGATLRMPQVAGWGNAMRWLLTGDRFDAAEALRIGLVQEVTPVGEQVERAAALAETISKRAPMGVRATIESARKCIADGPEAAARDLIPLAQKLMASEDAEEGLQSFLERREAVFKGR